MANIYCLQGRHIYRGGMKNFYEITFIDQFRTIESSFTIEIFIPPWHIWLALTIKGEEGGRHSSPFPSGYANAIGWPILALKMFVTI